MTDREKMACLEEVEHYNDEDAYISDMALSAIWGDEAEIPESRLDELREIYRLGKITINQISERTGMSYRKIAERFGIPYRTMEAWSGGKRKPPLYVLLMIDELLR